MDERNREDLTRFARRWQAAGPALSEQRAHELASLDEGAALRRMLDLFQLWRPTERDTYGAELVEQQNAFARIRERERRGG